MTITQAENIAVLRAWMDRWGYSDEEAARILSKYRRVTAAQVRQVYEGEICPSPDTFKAWAAEIASSRNSEEDVVQTLMGMFRRG